MGIEQNIDQLPYLLDFQREQLKKDLGKALMEKMDIDNLMDEIFWQLFMKRVDNLSVNEQMVINRVLREFGYVRG